ncbi:MAG: glycosyltransferase [Granulosicoccus sp.]
MSVIIPSFNRLQVLKRAIASVRNQTFTAYELIVVDDGSTDGTDEWLTEIAKPDVTILQENSGVSHARNRAIEKARGTWLALLDSDDYWYPEKLERQMDYLHLHSENRICHCDEHWIRNGKRVNQKLKHRKRGGIIFGQCLSLCAISPSAVVIQKTLLEEVGPFDETLPACEDYELWLRITQREPVLYVDEPLLVKTGGHVDQLSQRYPAMDQFRIQALAALLRNADLSRHQREMSLKVFAEKMSIYCQGALKRNKSRHVRELQAQYADLLNDAIVHLKDVD